MMFYIGRQLFSLTYTPVANLEAHIYPTCKCKGEVQREPRHWESV